MGVVSSEEMAESAPEELEESEGERSRSVAWRWEWVEYMFELWERSQR